MFCNPPYGRAIADWVRKGYEESRKPGKPKEDKNMLIINIVLALVAALLLFGVIGEKDGLKQQNITIAFVAVIVLIIALNRFF